MTRSPRRVPSSLTTRSPTTGVQVVGPRPFYVPPTFYPGKGLLADFGGRGDRRDLSRRRCFVPPASVEPGSRESVRRNARIVRGFARTP